MGKQYTLNASGTVKEKYTFEYDSLGRLIYSTEYEGSNTVLQRIYQTYDKSNRLSAQSWTVGSTPYSESYTYNDPGVSGSTGDGTLRNMKIASGETMNFTYDSLKRLTGASAWQGNNRLLSTFYNYRSRAGEDGNTYATTRVNQRNVYFGSGMTVSDIVYGERFYYDAVGNITSVYEGYTRTGNSAPLAMNGYTYDILSQLKQEVMCFPLSSGAGIFYNYTYDFTYDGGGNITKITEKDSRQGNAVVAEKTLSYENTIWGDLLTSVTKGSTTHTLFYDGTGNPINYSNGDTLYTNLTWENGRELTSLTTGDITYTYAYDAEGIRTTKVVDGITHSYITQNGKVVRETIGTGATAKVLDFIYDNNGQPFALRYSTNGASVRQVTLAVNGGTSQLSEREERYKIYLAFFGG